MAVENNPNISKVRGIVREANRRTLMSHYALYVTAPLQPRSVSESMFPRAVGCRHDGGG